MSSYHNRPALNLLYLASKFSVWTLLVFKLKRQIKILMRRRRKSSAYDVPSLDIKGKLILLPEERRSGNLAKSWICIFVALMHVPDLFTAAPQICPHTQWHQNVTLPSAEWFSNPEYWFLSLFLSWEKSFQGRGSAAANSSGPNPAKYFQEYCLQCFWYF